MNDNSKHVGTRFDMLTPHLRVSPADMPPAWRRVYEDLKARGFVIAANNMRDIMRATTPRAYFTYVVEANPRAGVVA